LCAPDVLLPENFCARSFINNFIKLLQNLAKIATPNRTRIILEAVSKL